MYRERLLSTSAPLVGPGVELGVVNWEKGNNDHKSDTHKVLTKALLRG